MKQLKVWCEKIERWMLVVVVAIGLAAYVVLMVNLAPPVARADGEYQDTCPACNYMTNDVVFQDQLSKAQANEQVVLWENAIIQAENAMLRAEVEQLRTAIVPKHATPAPKSDSRRGVIRLPAHFCSGTHC